MVTVFNGTAGPDALFPSGTFLGEMLAYGRGGNDMLGAGWTIGATLNGGAGNDTLVAGLRGDDHLNGGPGNDVLRQDYNSMAYTTMTDGHGADHFIVGPYTTKGGGEGGETVTITDFRPDEGDRLTESGGGSHTVEQVGRDVVVTFHVPFAIYQPPGGPPDVEQQVVLQHVRLAQLGDGWITRCELRSRRRPRVRMRPY